MILADVTDTDALSSLGIPGLVFIVIVLGGVIIYLFKNTQKLQNKLDAIQDQRVVDAKETRDKLTEPLAQNSRMSEQIYELLINGRGK
jgi:hypothetical protein